MLQVWPRQDERPLSDRRHPLYERFTDRARNAFRLADQEAHRFHHEYIGTEHVLLGFAMDESTVAVQVLKNLGIDADRIQAEVRKLVASGPEMVTFGKLPYTPSVRLAIHQAIEESNRFGHSRIGTQHILLAMLHNAGCVSFQILTNLGVTYYTARMEALKFPHIDEVMPPRMTSGWKGWFHLWWFSKD